MRPHGLERVGSGAEERGVGVELEGVGLGGVVVDAVQGYLGLGVWVWCVALRFCWVGVWRLVFGVGCLAFGVWCVVFGTWGFQVLRWFDLVFDVCLGGSVRCLGGSVWCLVCGELTEKARDPDPVGEVQLFGALWLVLGAWGVRVWCLVMFDVWCSVFCGFDCGLR